ncbi:MAG TPA: hypothetical protein PLW50_00230 [Smithellaceae bacterium]|nr:hypothetical protein [Smithellaceae bacterium]
MAIKTRADCVEQIVGYIGNLNQIVKAAKDSISEGDFVSSVDCIHKFYTAFGTISAAIIMFRGIITDEEIIKYHSTLNNIQKEFVEDTVKRAKKVRCFKE